jgi:hypothetical protein
VGSLPSSSPPILTDAVPVRALARSGPGFVTCAHPGVRREPGAEADSLRRLGTGRRPGPSPRGAGSICIRQGMPDEKSEHPRGAGSGR